MTIEELFWIGGAMFFLVSALLYLTAIVTLIFVMKTFKEFKQKTAKAITGMSKPASVFKFLTLRFLWKQLKKI